MTPEELVAALEAEVAAKQAELAAAQEAIAAAQQAAAAVQAELEAKQVELAAAVAAAAIPTPLNGNITALQPYLMQDPLWCGADATFALIRKSDNKVIDAPVPSGSIAQLLEGVFGAGVYYATVNGPTLTITGASSTGPINIASIGIKHHGGTIYTFINVG